VRMSLPKTVESPLRLRWSSVAAPARLPLEAITPSLDAITLFVAAVVVNRFGGLGFVYTALAFCFLTTMGTQRARINPRLSDDVMPILGMLAFPLLVVAPFAASDSQLGGLVRIVPAAILLVLLGRGVSYKLTRDARARGFVREPTLIIGAGTLGAQAATTLQDHPEYGLVPVGFLDSFNEDDLPLPILGDVHELDQVVKDLRVKRVIIAFGATREPELVPILRACDRLPIEIHVMPRFFELGVAPEGPNTDDLWGIPLMKLRRSALRTVAWRTKRMVDLVLGSILLLLSSPVLLACAAAVRMTSHGPVFFRQERVGQRGENFQLLKLRTLRANVDSDTTWSVGNDRRRTAIGRFLRRTSLDELPQLINVVKGEMSLVGPRPERPYFVDQFRVAVPGYDDRHRVPAGLTGWAQVHGLRGDTSIKDRARFDNHYVEHWSLWRDAVIMARTVGTVLRGEGR
jgi:exopolysaccharide biosynthesis polyprenyl glycosylphosphotransferase